MLPSLQDILAHKRDEVVALKSKLRLAGSTTVMRALTDTRSLIDAIAAAPFSVIPELKKTDPWVGEFRERFDPTGLARALVEAGAPAIAVQTDERYFGGGYDDLYHAAHVIKVPVLQRDFVIDTAQMTHAKAMGADATTLTVGLISGESLSELREFGTLVMIETLVEARTEAEVDLAIACEPQLIGVPARMPESDDVDFESLAALRTRVPDTIPMYVASGVRSADDVARIRDAGFVAVIVGGALMRSDNAPATYATLIGS